MKQLSVLTSVYTFVVCKLMLYPPSALSKITTRAFMNDCCLLLWRTLPVSLSLKRTLVGVRRFSAQFGTSGIHFWYSNRRNSRSKSGLCCRVRPSFLHIDDVVSACTFPRPLDVVDYNQFYTARISGKNLEISCRQEDSRLVTMSNIFVTAFIQCSRMLHTYCCALVASCLIHLCAWLREGPTLFTCAN